MYSTSELLYERISWRTTVPALVIPGNGLYFRSFQMSQHKNFVENLRTLQKSYPEYRNILQLLIEQIEQGKEARIQGVLKQLRDERW